MGDELLDRRGRLLVVVAGFGGDTIGDVGVGDREGGPLLDHRLVEGAAPESDDVAHVGGVLERRPGRGIGAAAHGVIVDGRQRVAERRADRADGVRCLFGADGRGLVSALVAVLRRRDHALAASRTCRRTRPTSSRWWWPSWTALRAK